MLTQQTRQDMAGDAGCCEAAVFKDGTARQRYHKGNGMALGAELQDREQSS